MSPPSFGAAARILAERDPVIARLVAEAGPPRLSRPTETHFGTLVRAIVYQQLAGRAAAAIHGRLIAALGGEVRPEPLLALSDEQMRAVGLSRNKMASLRDLAAKVLDGTVVLSPRGLARESDDEIVARLSAVRGIGPWTAEMFLLFQLRRLDVWPVGDLGVRRGYGLAWQVPEPTARELKPLGEPFRPYRSVAAWYCWRAAELYAGAAESALTGARAPGLRVRASGGHSGISGPGFRIPRQGGGEPGRGGGQRQLHQDGLAHGQQAIGVRAATCTRRTRRRRAAARRRPWPAAGPRAAPGEQHRGEQRRDRLGKIQAHPGQRPVRHERAGGQGDPEHGPPRQQERAPTASGHHPCPGDGSATGIRGRESASGAGAHRSA